jgi:hypothetical protein
MKSALDVTNRRALEQFLYELICEMRTPDETELLVDVLLTIQHRPNVPRCEILSAIPNHDPETHKPSSTG